MRIRVHLEGHLDIDIEHPTFVDLLDPTKPQDHEAVEDRVWLGEIITTTYRIAPWGVADSTAKLTTVTRQHGSNPEASLVQTGEEIIALVLEQAALPLRRRPPGPIYQWLQRVHAYRDGWGMDEAIQGREASYP